MNLEGTLFETLGIEVLEGTKEKVVLSMPVTPTAVSYTHLTLPTNREV